MTVNGGETGQALTETGGTETTILPGAYRGDIVLTVAEANPVSWQSFTYPFRQGLYVDNTGVVSAKSVLASVVGGQVSNSYAKNIKITSTGEAFNGVYVTDGDYTLENPRFVFTGNGRSDFVGYGAAIVGTGTNTRLVVAADAAVTAPAGHTITMTVDGVPTTIVPGSTYTGSIVLTVN
jgi:hypothetical protein